MAWLLDNIATVLVSLAVAAVVCLIVHKLIKDKKAGRHSCGAGCSSCAACRGCSCGGDGRNRP